MITIEFYTRNDCLACGVMMRNLTSALEITRLKANTIIRYGELDITKEFVDNKVEMFPTLIIKKDDKELTRFMGTYPVDYLINVFDKLCE